MTTPDQATPNQTIPDQTTADPTPYDGPVVAIPVYAGVSELELGIMLTICRLCGTDQAARTVNRSRASIVTAGGLVTTPHVLYAALPEPAALLVPGGPGAARASRDPLLKPFLAAHAHLPTGASGSGLLLLGEAGNLKNHEVGSNPELTDTLWNYQVKEVLPGLVHTHHNLCTTPSGFPALHAALHIATQLWGIESALDAAQRLGKV